MAAVSSSLFLKQTGKTSLTKFTSPSVKLPHRRNFQILTDTSSSITTFSRIYLSKTSNFRVDCSIINKHEQQHSFNSISGLSSPSSRFDDAVDAVFHVLKPITKHTIAVAVSLCALFMGDSSIAIAASGGRMEFMGLESFCIICGVIILFPFVVHFWAMYKSHIFATIDALTLGVRKLVNLFAAAGRSCLHKLANLFANEKTSVLKLQIGLLGSTRSLQSDLNRIVEVADTSTPKGLSFVLTETVLALLRHPNFCISGYSSNFVKLSMDEGEKRFNQLSIEERAKFDKEKLVNVNNIIRTSSKRASRSSNEFIVITILVAAKGVHELPAISSTSNLKEVLHKFGAIPTNQTMAVQVLWTPQNELKLLNNYPALRLL